MAIFSYIVASDNGFSPNPFHKVCTLACCKPIIRKTCKVGDYIIGLTPIDYGHKMIYAMRVEKKITFDEYWRDEEYKCKRPDMDATCEVKARGDNIYEPVDIDEDIWRAHKSFHFPKTLQDKRNCFNDIKNDYNCVVLSRDFVYYGSNAKDLPDDLREQLKVGRFHRRTDGAEIIENWENFFKTCERGLKGCPPYVKCKLDEPSRGE